MVVSPRLGLDKAEDVGAGNNAFALAMYSQLRDLAGNIFFSPFSVRVALAMTAGGAKGRTESEMRDVLRLPQDGTSVHSSLAGDDPATELGRREPIRDGHSQLALEPARG